MNILLVADRPGWAYDILAQSLCKHSSHDQISVVYVSELREDIGSADFSKFDVVFFFLWYDAMRYGVKINGFKFRKTCVGIHSLSSWSGRGLDESQASLVCNQFAAAGYISKEINRLLSLERGFFTPNGVERDLFYPSTLPSLDTLRLMWVGNPGNKHHGINKGFHSVVRPVVEEFKERGVVLSTATPESPVLREDMGEFYRSNHVLICASQHEGGPLPVVESLACGRPVITTAVGIVPEIVIDGENGIIIERKRSNLRAGIEAMLGDKDLVNRLASSIGNSIDGRYAEQMAAMYDAMFEFVYQFQQEGVA